jgi:hypothetical protein
MLPWCLVRGRWLRGAAYQNQYCKDFESATARESDPIPGNVAATREPFTHAPRPRVALISTG